MLGSLGRVTNILRFSSKSRNKSKDDGSNAKRQRAQSYDEVDEYRKGGASVKGGGGSPTSSERRREGGFDGAGQANPPSSADDTSSGSMSTEADRQHLREAAPISASSQALASMDPRALEARQVEEKEFIRQNDTAEAHIWYLVDVQWLQAWKHFVTRGGALPGPIENSRLIDRQTGLPRPGLRAVGDYRGVNDAIWYFWHSRYGGGPVVCRKHLDLYSAPIKEPDELAARRALAPQLPGANLTSEPNGEVPNLGARRESPWRPAARMEASPQVDERDESDTSHSSGVRSTPSRAAASTATPTPPRDSPPQRSSSERGASGSQSASSRTSRAQGNSSSSSFFGLGGTRNAPSFLTTRTPQSSSSRGQAEEHSQESRKTLCCDKCDGPHETDRCPHFKKARDSHEDAWANKGKAKVIADKSATAPVIRPDRARVVPQPGDGSCLFHSLSYGLDDRSSASSLRREICGYIAKNPDMKIADTAIKDWIQYDSNDSVSTYAQRMSGGTWGGGIEMAALTRMKNVNVHVYEKCKEGYRRISAFESPGAQKTVSVLYQGRMHYDAIEV